MDDKKMKLQHAFSIVRADTEIRTARMKQEGIEWKKKEEEFEQEETEGTEKIRIYIRPFWGNCRNESSLPRRRAALLCPGNLCYLRFLLFNSSYVSPCGSFASPSACRCFGLKILGRKVCRAMALVKKVVVTDCVPKAPVTIVASVVGFIAKVEKKC